MLLTGMSKWREIVRHKKSHSGLDPNQIFNLRPTSRSFIGLNMTLNIVLGNSRKIRDVLVT